MIVDRLGQSDQYNGLHPRLVRALEFLRREDLMALPLGRIELEGDLLFALVQEYTTKDAAQCRWEAHRKYHDVQFVARGVERIGVCHIDFMQVEQPHDAERDVAFFRGEGDFITLRAGSFAIFAPQDVHLPCTVAGQPELVRKIVIKAACGTH